MRNTVVHASLVGLVGLVFVLPTAARAAGTMAPAPAARGGFQQDWLGVVSYEAKQVLDLEDAVPQNKFKWRPGPGVRSIAEAYLHIAYGNYGLASAATGKEPPAEAGWEKDPAKRDAKTTDKAAIKQILEKSFAYVKETVGALPDADLDKQRSFFGREMSARAILIILSGHIDEHLGQSVAYARMNKIVPPWSKNEKAAMAQQKQ